VAGMGIEDARFRLEWISAAEADKLKAVMNEMTEKLRALGPLDWKVPAEQFAHPQGHEERKARVS
jgi:coenzyme F420-reducing hydrogenase delta subunit